jgi:hypothetical protein
MNEFIQSRVHEIAQAALEAMKLQGRVLTTEDESRLLSQVTQTVSDAINGIVSEYSDLQSGTGQ